VSETSAAVRFENITKRFPGVQALDDVSLEIARGSCHALCGENGAGKSTLGKILAGIYEPDGGRLFVDGREVAFTGPRDALAAGVGMVHQELAFCANLSIAENLCLAALPSERGFVERSELSKRANTMLAEIGAELDVSRPLGELTTAQQQIVQIASAVGSGAPSGADPVGADRARGEQRLRGAAEESSVPVVAAGVAGIARRPGGDRRATGWIVVDSIRGSLPAVRGAHGEGRGLND